MNKGKKNTEQEIPKREVSNTGWWTWPLESPLGTSFQLAPPLALISHPPTSQGAARPDPPGGELARTPPADPMARPPFPNQEPQGDLSDQPGKPQQPKMDTYLN